MMAAVEKSGKPKKKVVPRETRGTKFSSHYLGKTQDFENRRGMEQGPRGNGGKQDVRGMGVIKQKAGQQRKNPQPFLSRKKKRQPTSKSTGTLPHSSSRRIPREEKVKRASSRHGLLRKDHSPKNPNKKKTKTKKKKQHKKNNTRKSVKRLKKDSRAPPRQGELEVKKVATDLNSQELDRAKRPHAGGVAFLSPSKMTKAVGRRGRRWEEGIGREGDIGKRSGGKGNKNRIEDLEHDHL